MSTPNLQTLIKKSPEEIVNWFTSKGYTLSWNWKDTWQEAHTKSFTVAKVMKLDILQDIRNSYLKSLKDGESFRDFQFRLAPKLKTVGWWGKVAAKDVPGYENLSADDKALIDPDEIVQLGSPHRLRKIFSTNNNVAYNSGRWKSQIENAEFRPYLQYVQIQRANKREEHSQWHLLVFRYDDPIWNRIYPPNGFECGCRVRALSKAEIKQRGLTVSKGKDYADTSPDEGWNYNPGQSAFKPDENKYDKDLLDAFNNS